MALTNSQLRKLRAAPSDQNRLRLARELLVLSQGEAAAAIGIAQSVLSDQERSRYGSNTSIATAGKLAAFYGCAIEDLFPASKQEVG